MKSNISITAVRLLIGTLVIAAITLAWWGWQTLDSSLLLLGSRLC